MTSTHKYVTDLEIQLNNIKEDIKISKDFLLVSEFWNKREDFTFKSKISVIGDVALFGYYNSIFSCGELRKSLTNQLKHFVSTWENEKNQKHSRESEIKKLISSLNRLVKFQENEKDRFNTIKHNMEYLFAI